MKYLVRLAPTHARAFILLPRARSQTRMNLGLLPPTHSVRGRKPHIMINQSRRARCTILCVHALLARGCLRAMEPRCHLWLLFPSFHGALIAFSCMQACPTAARGIPRVTRGPFWRASCPHRARTVRDRMVVHSAAIKGTGCTYVYVTMALANRTVTGRARCWWLPARTDLLQLRRSHTGVARISTLSGA